MNAIFTIAADNYWSRVAFLAQSIRAFSGSLPVVAICSDAEPEPLPGVFCLSARQIERNPHFLAGTTTEVCTRLKPAAFQFLFATLGERRLLYVDPDCVFLRDPAPIFECLAKHAAVLFPHRLAPGIEPLENLLLRVGPYNLGMLGLSWPKSEPLLAWWRERVETECSDGPAAAERCRFVDQSWSALFPCLADCYVNHDPAWNVAHWNLDERDPTDVALLHASGFDPASPSALSRHSPDRRVPRDWRAYYENYARGVENAAAELAPRVTVAGHYGDESGVAAIAGITTDMLEREGFRVNRKQIGASQQDPAAVHSTLIWHTNAAAMHSARYPNWYWDQQRVSRTIGVWMWELDSSPVGHDHPSARCHEVWAYSSFMHRAFRRVRRCYRIPLGLHAPPPDLQGNRPGAETRLASNRRSAAFRFGFFYDAHSVLQRKNPTAAIAAFRSAFPLQKRDVELLLKVSHATPQHLNDLRATAGGDGRVRIVNGFLERAEYWRLLASCHVYLSLHRSEGIGLTICEAMQIGRPVIATGYGGNVDFADDSHTFTVPFTLVGLDQELRPYPAGSRWAEPDHEYAVEAMRLIASDEQRCHDMGQAARAHARQAFCPRRAGQAMRQRLLECDG